MAPGHHLTPAQQRVLALLSAGSTATAAAQFVGVHRNTVGNWLRSTAFREALIETRRDQGLAWREQARSLAGQALGAIQAVLADPQASAAVRLEAALAIHGRPHAPSHAPSDTQPASPNHAAQPSRNQPCPCGSGRKFKRCCMSTH
jgi:preprotein translocase subunit SecA